MQIKSNRKTFFKQIIYYLLRYLSEKNIKNYNIPIAGFSFDSIHHHINIYGTYEIIEIDVLKEFIKENLTEFDIALDIGANIGNHTIRLLAKKFKRVYCYEPNPKIFDLLSINMKPFNNVTCLNFGLSDRAAELPFIENKSNMGASYISNFKNHSPEIKQINKVKVRALDDENFNGKINLIKVDIESHEIYFLRGAEKTIKKHSPIILFEEYLINDEGSSDVIEFLKKLDYEFYTINQNFDFGETVFHKLVKHFAQDIFGIKIKLEKTKIFQKKFYHLIIASPISKNN